jgi:hypothetical protein
MWSVFRPILDAGTSKTQDRGLIVSNRLFGCFLANPWVCEEWSSHEDVLWSWRSSRKRRHAIRQIGRCQIFGRKCCYIKQSEVACDFDTSLSNYTTSSQKFVILKSWIVNCYHRTTGINVAVANTHTALPQHCCGLRIRIRRESREWQYCELCGIFGRPSIPSIGWCEDMCRSDTFRSKFYFL